MPSFFEVEVPDSETNVIRENLNKALAVNSAIVSVGIFSFIFSVKFGFSSNLIQLFSDGFLDSQNLYERVSLVLNEKLHEVLLFLTTVIWYVIYRKAVDSEISLLSELHSAANLPKSFASYSSFSTIVFLSVGLTLTFTFMAFSVNYFPIFVLFLLLTSIQDITGNRLLMIQLRELQQQKDEDIPASDPMKSFISQIREECYKYWLYKPQIERIAVFIVANVCALFMYLFLSGVAFSDILAPKPEQQIERYMWFFLRFRNPDIGGYNFWIILSYLTCIGAMIWNEFTMNGWRKERNAALRSIFARRAEFRKTHAQGGSATVAD